MSFAQSRNNEPEKSAPLRDKEVVRNVSVLDVEGTLYKNVKITMKSISAYPYSIFSDNRVKVTVRDKDGKKIWKKTFRNAYMYVFRSGQVQIGKPKFDQIVIFKSEFDNFYTGVIREKEGVY